MVAIAALLACWIGVHDDTGANAVQRASAAVLVPAGPFVFGCDREQDPHCTRFDLPEQTVTLPAFRIDRHEVTVGEYAACVDAGGCPTARVGTPGFGPRIDDDPNNKCNWLQPGRDGFPMNCIDWQDASTFCAWARGRLPSEQEWEKAARGTEGGRYPWGDASFAEAPRHANIKNAEESWESRLPRGWDGFDRYDDGYLGIAPVGSFPAGASPYGALDMVGNVWEWTASTLVPDGVDRVLRGGSYANSPHNARAARRFSNRPVARQNSWGFRCAYDPAAEMER